MNTQKTFSLLAAAIIVAGQATLFAVDTRSSTQSVNTDSSENVYEAKATRSSPAYGATQNASTIRGA
jgi:hypothetical protein